MLPHSRAADRTERYLDDLLAADERRAGTPTDVDTHPEVRTAAAALSSGLVRVHPSFRFEEALAGRLSEAGLRMRAGLPAEAAPGATRPSPAAVSAFPGAAAGSPDAGRATPGPSGRGTIFRRLPELAARQSRPLVIGGVGVASAAISLGAFYVAWRHTHAASGRMSRAARSAHGRSAQSGRNRPGIAEEIIGAIS